MDIYREELLDHVKHPRNFGSLEHPTVTTKNANPSCGDEMIMQLEVVDGIVRDVRFSGDSCAISKASASMLTQSIKGRSIAEVRQISTDDQLKLLGAELTPSRQHCALLSLETLKRALDQAGSTE
jgi:nitrogen fixation protein NifU and related proteins